MLFYCSSSICLSDLERRYGETSSLVASCLELFAKRSPDCLERRQQYLADFLKAHDQSKALRHILSGSGDLPPCLWPESVALVERCTVVFERNCVGSINSEGVPIRVPQCSRTTMVPLMPEKVD